VIDCTDAESDPKIPTHTQGPLHWIGIDGCRGGWIVAWLKANQPAEIHYIEALQPFLKKAPKEAIILIDMILYKSNEISPRPFDRFAKSQLGKWHSRVFPAPPQAALVAKDYPEACKRSLTHTGKKISKQCYHLFPKIREANHPSIPKEQLIEYHPEIAFKQLNQNKTVEASKKTELGRNQRQALLEAHLPNVSIPSLSPRAKKQHWQADDLLDALALALVAQNKRYQDFYQSIAEAEAVDVNVDEG
jgi:predicted RNase H-like nuclease